MEVVDLSVGNLEFTCDLPLLDRMPEFLSHQQDELFNLFMKNLNQSQSHFLVNIGCFCLHFKVEISPVYLLIQLPLQSTIYVILASGLIFILAETL